MQRSFVFDAYGTLFDVHSVVMTLQVVTPEAVSRQWRVKQREYSWLRALMLNSRRAPLMLCLWG